MLLNTKPVDPSKLKVMILSCPKTGNTWLRWLVHNAYGMEIVDLPRRWNDEDAAELPDSFVTHQHLWPSPELVKWIVDHDVVVMTTLRHPGDTLVSYFHFAKWQELNDPAAAAMREDGERPGRNTAKYAKYAFAWAYSISLAWARLGAHVVRYEDLLQDPLAQLRKLTDRIAPLDDARLRAATLLCKPEQLTRPGLVDPRHIRTGTARRWVRELGPEIVEMMARMEPYKSACEAYGYDWGPASSEVPHFDYDAIDPFRGRETFDNGEPIGPSLPKVYLHEAGDSLARWPDPLVTRGDSFWRWLISPSPDAGRNAEFPAGTYTNLMAALYRLRPDVRESFPDPAGADRAVFVSWFLGQAAVEFELSWALIAPVADSFCEHLGAIAA